MEKSRSHGKQPTPPPLAPPRRARGDRERASGASFSASLLDAIYHSLDERSDADADATTRRSEEKVLAPAPAQFWWAGKPKLQAAGEEDRRRRRETGPVARPRHSGYASSTTSSSDSTSSYSFSCSSASTTDTESTRCRRTPPPPRRQPEDIVDDMDTAEATEPPTNKAKKKGRPCFPVVRLRPRDAAPSSPGPALPPSPATFACVLKTLFTSGRLPRKPRTPTRSPSARTPPELPQPSCASAADANMTERRCVRFCPDAEASVVVRRRVEELVRSLGELEEDDEGSDSSSDLFELESLAGANGDELPVYGTTSLVANRAIAHAAVF